MRFTDARISAAALVLLLTACSAPAPKPAAPPAQLHAAAPTVPPSEVPPAAPAAPAGPSTALKKQFADAVTAMKNGKDEAAMRLFSAIAEQNPQLASPHTDLGILYYRQGRLKEAETAFKDALQRDAKDYVAANYLGMIYRSEGRFAEAKAAYLQALAAKPDYALAHLNMAILYDLYTGELDQALQHYREYQKDGGAGNPQLAGWLADLEQRIKDRGGRAAP
jgi:tetratricopeptide (TPR) repeat protein